MEKAFNESFSRQEASDSGAVAIPELLLTGLFLHKIILCSPSHIPYFQTSECSSHYIMFKWI